LSVYDPKDGIRRACAAAEQSHNILSIFPGDTTPQGAGVVIPETEFVKLATDLKANNSGKMDGIGQTIIACIAYKSKGFHHTPYLLALNKADGTPTLLSEMMLNPHTIPLADVTLRQIPMDLVGSAD
jgi:hypothetical protein